MKLLYFSSHSLAHLSIALTILFPVTSKNSAGFVKASSGIVGMTFAVVEDIAGSLECKTKLLKAECAVGDESGRQRNGKEDLETFPQTLIDPSISGDLRSLAYDCDMTHLIIL